MAKPDPSNPEYQLYQEYHRKKRFWKIIFGVLIFLFFIFTAVVVLPKILGDGAAQAGGGGKVGEPLASSEASAAPESTPVASSPAGGTVLPAAEPISNDVLAGVDLPPPAVAAPANPVLQIDEKTQERLEDVKNTPPPSPPPAAPRAGIRGSVPEDARSSFREQRFVPASVSEEREAEMKVSKVIETFNAAASAEDFRGIVLYPDRVVPMIDEYLQRPGVRTFKFGGLNDRSFFRIKGHPYVIQTHHFADGSSGFIFAGFRHVDGEFFLDWESLVGYGDKEWAVMHEQKPTEPVLVRCYCVRSNYYNFEFSDSKQYMSYLLQDWGGESTLYGFVERGSEVHNVIDAAVLQKSPAPAILRVAYRPDSKSKRCVEIVEFVQETWITVADDPGVGGGSSE